jgi:hypothetical protein
MYESITRSLIANHVGLTFTASGTTTKSDLIRQAQATSANSAVLEVLLNLPDRNFANLRDLWAVLPDMPIE